VRVLDELLTYLGPFWPSAFGPPRAVWYVPRQQSPSNKRVECGEVASQWWFLLGKSGFAGRIALQSLGRL
jgi:hypothetical protein